MLGNFIQFNILNMTWFRTKHAAFGLKLQIKPHKTQTVTKLKYLWVFYYNVTRKLESITCVDKVVKLADDASVA